MKKIIFALALVMMAFGTSAAYACDGMKGHERADKSDQGSSSAKASKDGKGSAKADQKS
ncbi:MAG TPA: hypothetical protein VGP07_25670 [Polyangia bacterium]|jgi:hypothetical protein